MWLNFKRRKPVRRVYAIGDIHGRLDLFERMIAVIRRDHAGRIPVSTQIVLLGDLIDRGPDSANLVRWSQTLTEQSDRFVVLKGNHEAMMADALNGDFAALELWWEHGARATLASWGVPEAELERGPGVNLLQAARQAVGADTLAWLAALPLTVQHEEYLFVHAGVRPGVGLKNQLEHDLLWIRHEFLASKVDHGAIVVHGHSVHESGPQILRNRIGIDSGAFRTGRLSAIGVEDGQVWPLMTERAADRKVAGRATTQPVPSENK